MQHDDEYVDQYEPLAELLERQRPRGWWRRNRTTLVVLGLVAATGTLFVKYEIQRANESERDRKLLLQDDGEWMAMHDELQRRSEKTEGATAHLTIKAGEEDALVEVRDADGTVFMVTSIGARETAIMRAPEGEWTVRLKEGTAAKESREMMREMAFYEDLATMRAYEEGDRLRAQAGEGF